MPELTSAPSDSPKRLKPRRSFFRFSVRTLLVLVSLTALGIVGYQECKQRLQESQTGRLLIECGAMVEGYFNDVESDRNIESLKFDEAFLPRNELYRLPHLRAARFEGEKKYTTVYITQNDLDFLKRCPKLENLTFESCTLYLDEETLIWLSEFGATLKGKTAIRECELSTVGIEALNRMQCDSVSFCSCKFTDQAIRSLEIDPNKQCAAFYDTELTADEVLEVFGDQVHEFIAHPGLFYLCNDLEKEFIIFDTKKVGADIFKQMPNLKHISLRTTEPSYLEAIENCQPKATLYSCFCGVKELDTLRALFKATPSLKARDIKGLELD